MRAGDLVKTTRAQVGVPLGSIGLIIKSQAPRAETIKYSIHDVQLIGVVGALGYPSTRRYLSIDLEVVNESR